MVHKEVLEEFFAAYGSAVQSADGQGETCGVLAPVRDLGMEFDRLNFPTVGYVPKREYVLLSPAENTVVDKQAELLIDGRRFRVVETEEYRLAGVCFYKRAYLYELREVVR